MKGRVEGKSRGLPSNVDAPELAADAALLESGKVRHTEEFGRVGEVLLVYVVLVEGADPDWEVIVRI